MAPKANPPRQPLSNDGVEGIVESSLQRKQGNVVRGRGQYAVEYPAKKAYSIVRIKLVGLRKKIKSSYLMIIASVLVKKMDCFACFKTTLYCS